MDKQRRAKNGKQATKARRDSIKLRQVEVLMRQGVFRLDAIRQIGVVEQTYYRWQHHFSHVKQC